MSQQSFVGIISLALHVFIQIAVIVRVLLRPHREAASRIAWVVVIVALPVLGIVTYLLLGETNIGHRRVARMRKVISQLPDVNDAAGEDAANLQVDVPRRYAQLLEDGTNFRTQFTSRFSF
jgi:cardiolipin synthase